jgi:Fe-S oxidoreductase
VGVDVAAWKAEFLSRYYRGRLRPAAAYSMGLVHRWAAVASAAPGVANFLTQTPGLASITKAIGGVSQKRRIPRFASETFRSWFSRRSRASPKSQVPGPKSAGRSVLLFTDTFTNYFTPRIGQSAVDVLESAGFAVEIPPRRVCCGRPLYDWGMLDAARQTLADALDVLSDATARGLPVVVLEPSCAAVFKDELPELFPRDDRAASLAGQTALLAGFLEGHASDWSSPTLPSRGLLQFHCHQRALFGVKADRRLLSRMGIEAAVPDAGCCGMAGAFGFEKSRYGVSMAIGERALLPEVRNAPGETLIVADGFSCREQIEHGTGRRALHLAEVIRRAMERTQT